MTGSMKHYFVKCSRLGGWLLLIAITVLSLVPADMRPETGVPHNLEHFAIFAATGFAFGLGYYQWLKVTSVALIIFTGAVELAQIVVPGRHARFEDFIVDALAMVIAAAVGTAIMNNGVIPLIGRGVK
jgi:hypothetical protein